MKKRILNIVGVDEVGRGPLAGPVAVGIVLISAHFDWRELPGVHDSKQLSVPLRESVVQRAKQLKLEGKIDFCITSVSAKVIDRIGITKAITLCIERGMRRLAVDPHATKVKLDGLLRAPKEFTYQETIVKGDAKEKVIGLASILAKVQRDRYMTRIAQRYPVYAFEKHKGYGTAFHKKMIQKHGFSPLHRHSFCRFAEKA